MVADTALPHLASVSRHNCLHETQFKNERQNSLFLGNVDDILVLELVLEAHPLRSMLGRRTPHQRVLELVHEISVVGVRTKIRYSNTIDRAH